MRWLSSHWQWPRGGPDLTSVAERFVAVDLETTGLDPRTDAIVALAAIPFVGGQPQPGLVTLVQPGRPIPPPSTAIHGITDEMVAAAPAVPRSDLVAVFLTGVPGLTQPARVQPAEMLRLNTAIAPVPPADQNALGVLGGDLAGFPNGRRPGDDVVDVALRAMMGVLLPPDRAPAGQLPYTDGALAGAEVAYAPSGALTATTSLRLFRPTFPYLQTPLSGSPNPIHGSAP